MSKHTPGPWKWETLESRRGPEWSILSIGGLTVESRSDETYVSCHQDDQALIAAAPKLLEAASLGHDDSPGLPCGDLLAAANVLRNSNMDDLAARLEAKHEAERAAIAAARGAE